VSGSLAPVRGQAPAASAIEYAHYASPSVAAGGVLQTTALQIEDGRIAAIYVTRNPDKLRHLNGEGVH
jgi:hypothetical protein